MESYQPKTPKEYHVGMAYRRGNQLFLSVEETTLLTGRNGVITELSTDGLRLVNTSEISIEEICENWGVTKKVFEKAAEPYFRPDESGRLDLVPDWDPDEPVRLNSTAWRRIRQRPPSIRRGKIRID